MTTLYIRTDQTEAELQLECGAGWYEVKWQAHRELSDTILLKIKELLDRAEMSWQDLEAVAVFEGPGSFTGLRIGITVANTLSYSLGIPIVSARSDHWLDDCDAKLTSGKNQKVVTPFYGREARITKPRK